MSFLIAFFKIKLLYDVFTIFHCFIYIQSCKRFWTWYELVFSFNLIGTVLLYSDTQSTADILHSHGTNSIPYLHVWCARGRRLLCFLMLINWTSLLQTILQSILSFCFKWFWILFIVLFLYLVIYMFLYLSFIQLFI